MRSQIMRRRALHPGLAEVYRTRVAHLRAQLPTSAPPEVREALRALIARVKIHPPEVGEAGPRIELIGHLAALLRAGGADGPEMLLCSVKDDAGTRNRRSQYITVLI